MQITYTCSYTPTHTTKKNLQKQLFVEGLWIAERNRFWSLRAFSLVGDTNYPAFAAQCDKVMMTEGQEGREEISIHIPAGEENTHSQPE